MTSLDQEQHACIGIHLDGTGVESAEIGTQSPQTSTKKHTVPPAALLPFWPGETARADIRLPLHRRGSGLNQDHETTVDRRIGSGRYPVAFAWNHLVEQGQNPRHEWSWRSKAEYKVTLPAAEALAICAYQSMKEITPASNTTPLLGLVIPEACGTFAQDALLEACRGYHMEPLLIWRSVAATSWWIDQNKDLIDSANRQQNDDGVLADLIHIHLGLEAVEMTRVALVGNSQGEQPTCIPGRYRAKGFANGNLHSRGLCALIEQSCVEASKHDLATQPINDWWTCVWGSDNLVNHLTKLQQDDEENKTVHHRLGELFSHPAKQQKALGDLTISGAQDPTNTWKLEVFRDQLARLFQTDRKSEAIGIVLTGPLANSIVHDKRMPEHIRKWAQTDLPIWSEGSEIPPGSLASQAAVLRQRVEQNIPAWYDTLPSIELIAQNKEAEPEWIQLLKDDDAWVAGGKPWGRPEPISGFSLSSGQLELVLPISHEEFDTVRDLSVAFRESSPTTVPIEIDVQMTPAQGQARLKVIPAAGKTTGIEDLDRGVLANWQSMRDTELDAQAYLNNMPRAYPPVLPRIASWDRCRLSSSLMRDIVSGEENLSNRNLQLLSDELKRTDYQSTSPGMQAKQATFASSDGKPYTQEAQKTLNQLVKLLIKKLKSESYDPDLVRAIGYTSTSDPYFQKFLIKKLKNKFKDCPREIYYACSFTLREPKGFELLVGHANEEFSNTGKVSNYRLISISRCLQYRPQICHTLDTASAHHLANATLNMFNEKLDLGEGKMVFRNSATLLGYLLRYRMIESEFLPMGDTLTNQLRNAFAKAYFLSDMYRPDTSDSQELRKRFPKIHKQSSQSRNKLETIGGVIDIQAALIQLLGYVERRGKGVLQMVSDG